jgi:transposase
MAEQTTESIPARYRLKVKQRLAILEYASRHSLLAASRRFAMNRKTIREWRTRYRAKGVQGLIPVYPDRRRSRLPAEVIELIAHARRDLQYGAARTQCGWRVHQSCSVRRSDLRPPGAPVWPSARSSGQARQLRRLRCPILATRSSRRQGRQDQRAKACQYTASTAALPRPAALPRLNGHDLDFSAQRALPFRSSGCGVTTAPSSPWPSTSACAPPA